MDSDATDWMQKVFFPDEQVLLTIYFPAEQVLLTVSLLQNPIRSCREQGRWRLPWPLGQPLAPLLSFSRLGAVSSACCCLVY